MGPHEYVSRAQCLQVSVAASLRVCGCVHTCVHVCESTLCIATSHLFGHESLLETSFLTAIPQGADPQGLSPPGLSPFG